MSKLLSILVAAMFAVSTGSAFAATHSKAAAEKSEMKKEAKAPAKKAVKKAHKAKAKKAMKKEEKK